MPRSWRDELDAGGTRQYWRYFLGVMHLDSGFRRYGRLLSRCTDNAIERFVPRRINSQFRPRAVQVHWAGFDICSWRTTTSSVLYCKLGLAVRSEVLEQGRAGVQGWPVESVETLREARAFLAFLECSAEALHRATIQRIKFPHNSLNRSCLTPANFRLCLLNPTRTIKHHLASFLSAYLLPLHHNILFALLSISYWWDFSTLIAKLCLQAPKQWRRNIDCCFLFTLTRNRLAAYAVSESGVQLSWFIDIGSRVPRTQLLIAVTTCRYTRRYYPDQDPGYRTTLRMVDELEDTRSLEKCTVNRTEELQDQIAKMCSSRAIFKGVVHGDPVSTTSLGILLVLRPLRYKTTCSALTIKSSSKH